MCAKMTNLPNTAAARTNTPEVSIPSALLYALRERGELPVTKKDALAGGDAVTYHSALRREVIIKPDAGVVHHVSWIFHLTLTLKG